MLRRSDDNNDKQALQWTQQRHRGRGLIKEHLQKKSGERNVDSTFQVQLEEDELAAQDSYMKTSGLWPTLQLETSIHIIFTNNAGVIQLAALFR